MKGKSSPFVFGFKYGFGIGVGVYAGVLLVQYVITIIDKKGK